MKNHAETTLFARFRQVTVTLNGKSKNRMYILGSSSLTVCILIEDMYTQKYCLCKDLEIAGCYVVS